MLKPKYVHGVNADEARSSVLHRLQNDGQKVWPFDDLPSGDPGDNTDDDGGGVQWGWTVG